MNKEELLKYSEEALDKLQRFNLKEEKQLLSYRSLFESDPSMAQFLEGLKENEEVAEELKESEESFRNLVEKIKKS